MTDLIQDQPPGSTPLEDVSGLLLPEITTRGPLNEVETINISQAVEWISRGRINDVFTVPFYKKLHLRMLCDVWSWAGQTRKTDLTNIGVSGAKIIPELGALAKEANERWAESPDLIGFVAWYHHRAVWTHPFINGNGRWARLICDAFMIRVCEAPPLTWSTGDLARSGDERDAYIAALKQADENNIEPLVDFIQSRNPDV